MATLHVLRVFTNEDGEWGNRLGVFLDGEEIPSGDRQRVATDLDFSETVFVNGADDSELGIFTPAVELIFAGHPLVGTAWLIARDADPPSSLKTLAGEVGVRIEGEMTFIQADPSWAPSFEEIELIDPAEVHSLTGPPDQRAEVYVWAWIDEAAGTIRARCFAPGVGIPEDEATGSAALALCGRLGRPITIIQGKGSVLVARPLEDGRAEVGGRVALDEQREYRV